MNKRCYCKAELEKYEDPPPFHCKNCCRMVKDATENYWDPNSPCLFEEVSGSCYIVCTQCYEEDTDDIKNDLHEENTMMFILKKFMLSLSTIS